MITLAPNGIVMTLPGIIVTWCSGQGKIGRLVVVVSTFGGTGLILIGCSVVVDGGVTRIGFIVVVINVEAVVVVVGRVPLVDGSIPPACLFSRHHGETEKL